jgi:hypothetical protein
VTISIWVLDLLIASLSLLDSCTRSLIFALRLPRTRGVIVLCLPFRTRPCPTPSCIFRCHVVSLHLLEIGLARDMSIKELHNNCKYSTKMYDACAGAQWLMRIWWIEKQFESATDVTVKTWRPKQRTSNSTAPPLVPRGRGTVVVAVLTLLGLTTILSRAGRRPRRRGGTVRRRGRRVLRRSRGISRRGRSYNDVR